VSDADEICERGFKRLDLSAENVEPAVENTGDSDVNGSPLGEIAGAGISLWNRDGGVHRGHAITTGNSSELQVTLQIDAVIVE
jgi:hypothetical protein